MHAQAIHADLPVTDTVAGARSTTRGSATTFRCGTLTVGTLSPAHGHHRSGGRPHPNGMIEAPPAEVLGAIYQTDFYELRANLTRLPALDSRVAPREDAGVANDEYAVVVLGRGFCASVAALRAVEKG
jgi:hypothetical protein